MGEESSVRADWLCIGRPFCQAELRREFQTGGQFFCLSLYLVFSIQYLVLEGILRCICSFNHAISEIRGSESDNRWPEFVAPPMFVRISNEVRHLHVITNDTADFRQKTDVNLWTKSWLGVGRGAGVAPLRYANMYSVGRFLTL